MTDTEINHAIKHHKELNHNYYQRFIRRAPAKTPSLADLETLIRHYRVRCGGRMTVPYAQRIATVELNP